MTMKYSIGFSWDEPRPEGILGDCPDALWGYINWCEKDSNSYCVVALGDGLCYVYSTMDIVVRIIQEYLSGQQKRTHK